MTGSTFVYGIGTDVDDNSKGDYVKPEHQPGESGRSLRSNEIGSTERPAAPYSRLPTPPESIFESEDFTEHRQKRMHCLQETVRSKDYTLNVPSVLLSRRESASSNSSFESRASRGLHVGRVRTFSGSEYDSDNSKQPKTNDRNSTFRQRKTNYIVDEQTALGVSPKKEHVKKVFVDVEQMKEKIRNAAFKKVYDVSEFYYQQGLFQKIARHPTFEALTLFIIAFNAVWITVDTDTNKSEVLLHAHPVFQVAEQFFCLYFCFELFVRFKSFVKKRNCIRDPWFVFDSCLVLMMVLETWLMTCVMAFSTSGTGGGLGNASMLRMARLLRLSRMARMARLFRAMPELLILIKAMAASLRSCFFVFILLTIILYVFGIAFRQLTESSDVGEQYFFTVFASMHTLWKFGTLLDSLGDLVADLSDASYALVALFYLFLLLSALTVMNMLIGVLCEVVSTVASLEKEQMTVTFVKAKLQEIITVSGLDHDENGQITKAELSALLEFPEACKCLSDVGVDVFMLVDNIDFIFAGDDAEDLNAEDNERALSFCEFMDLILDLRGSNTATVKDMVQLQKYIKESNRRFREELHKVGAEVKKLIQGIGNDIKKMDGNRSCVFSDIPSGLATASSNSPKIDSRMEESLKLLKQEIMMLVGKSVVPDLQAACVKIESDCCKLLEALASKYEVCKEPSAKEPLRHAVTLTSPSARRPNIDNRQADNSIQGTRGARLFETSLSEDIQKHVVVSPHTSDEFQRTAERVLFLMELENV